MERIDGMDVIGEMISIDNSVIKKVELIEKKLLELKEMWYDVTFNTTASIRYQIENWKEKETKY